MKNYDVYFVVKANNKVYNDMIKVTADNAVHAKEGAYKAFKQLTGKHAFHLSIKKPDNFDQMEHFLEPRHGNI